MALSGTTVRAALAAVGAVGKQIRTFDELAAGADDALRQAPPGLTASGAAAFLATAAVESAWFRTTEEYGGAKTRYAPFYGRTFVQLTWEPNYSGFGTWCRAKGLVSDAAMFVKNPAALGDFRWAWLGAVYYFETHGIWRWANAGDFRAVSQAVNGGNGRVGTSFVPNGWAERQAMYRVFLSVGADLLPAGETTSGAAALPTLERGDEGPAVVALQRFLNAYGWRPALPLLPVNGTYGPMTTAVVKAAQAQMGITGPDADGETVGPRTNAALWQRGYRG